MHQCVLLSKALRRIILIDWHVSDYPNFAKGIGIVNVLTHFPNKERRDNLGPKKSRVADQRCRGASPDMASTRHFLRLVKDVQNR